jgi:hypothetical protein
MFGGGVLKRRWLVSLAGRPGASRDCLVHSLPDETSVALGSGYPLDEQGI